MIIELWRFMSHVQRNEATDCWLWVGSKDRKGYGRVQSDGKIRLAHRVAHQLFEGEIPQGLEVDHLCMVKRCVNPFHLEVVTPAVNTRRMVAVREATFKEDGTLASRPTHCKNGHEYSPANTRMRPPGRGRVCRTCEARYERERCERRKVKRRADRGANAA